MHWISSWAIYSASLGAELEQALRRGKISESDEILSGPDGSCVVEGDGDDLTDTEYADYTYTGETVGEYLEACNGGDSD